MSAHLPSPTRCPGSPAQDTHLCVSLAHFSAEIAPCSRPQNRRQGCDGAGLRFRPLCRGLRPSGRCPPLTPQESALLGAIPSLSSALKPRTPTSSYLLGTHHRKGKEPPARPLCCWGRGPTPRRPCLSRSQTEDMKGALGAGPRPTIPGMCFLYAVRHLGPWQKGLSAAFSAQGCQDQAQLGGLGSSRNRKAEIEVSAGPCSF